MSVGGPGDSIHSGKMTAIGEDIVTCGSVPDLHRMVPGARGNALTIGGPGDSSYYIRMTAIGKESASRGSVPDLHGLVFACRGNMPSIVGPRYGKHPSSMAMISEDEVLRRERGSSGHSSNKGRADARNASSQVQAQE